MTTAVNVSVLLWPLIAIFRMLRLFTGVIAFLAYLDMGMDHGVVIQAAVLTHIVIGLSVNWLGRSLSPGLVRSMLVTPIRFAPKRMSVDIDSQENAPAGSAGAPYGPFSANYEKGT